MRGDSEHPGYQGLVRNLQQHEWHVRTLQNLPRPVNVLSTHSAWSSSSLVLGCNGLLSGSGSVIPDLQSALSRAVRSNDLEETRRINDRIYPLARVFYSEPSVDMHNRMKEARLLLAARRAPSYGRHSPRSAMRKSRASVGRWSSWACCAGKPTPRRRANSGGDARRGSHRIVRAQCACSSQPAQIGE